MNKRPPIVTVLGHVDHGKTTLLDTLRETKVASREAGGITQGTAASKIETKEGQITFIDTPGHAAFSQMRERGAAIADVVILVVAADDGPKPQTLEALKYIQDSSTPFIVAFTKMDLPSASFEKAIGEMEKNQVLFEGRGGDTPFVKVSSKNKEGLDDLVELIHLVAEINEVKGDPEGELEVVVIETNKDKRGPVVSVVIKNGTLKVGQEIYFGEEKTKVRGLFDENGKSIKQANLSDPVVILGFSNLPFVGAIISSTPKNLDILQKKVDTVTKGELPIIVKVASSGSLDAVKASLPKGVYIISSGIGDVTDSDVFFAKTTGSTIFAFEAKVPSNVRKLAENENVEAFSFKIIYEMLQKIEEVLNSGQDEVLAKLEILAVFPYNKLQVAGCKVLEGIVMKGYKLKLFKGEKEKGETRIVSLKREKNEIENAKAGEECGIIFKPQLDFEIGDSLIAIK